MIVRILFWIGALPWIVALTLCGLGEMTGRFDGPDGPDTTVAIIAYVFLGFWSILFCWGPAIVYRFLFGRRRARDA